MGIALAALGFETKYFIEVADTRLGEKFAIASNGENCSLTLHTPFMTYEEASYFFWGYNKAKTNPLT